MTCDCAEAQEVLDSLACVLVKVRAAVSKVGSQLVNIADGQRLLDDLDHALGDGLT